MTERIKAHLDSLLQGAPNTRRVEEMRQELLAGCLDKYDDLTAEGVEPEEAFRRVIEGIGDVSELLGHIEKANTFDPVEMEKKRKKRALFTTVAIALFIIGVAVAIIAEYLGDADLGGILMFICFGAGVVVLVYGRMTNSVKYEKTEDTIVEDIKVQMAKGKKENRLLGLASGSLWCVIVILYFLLSFLTVRWWHLTWLIFIVGAAVQCGLTAYFIPETRSKSLAGAFWCGSVVVYFIFSFLTMRWDISWLIFVLAAAVQLSGRFFKAWRDEQ